MNPSDHHQLTQWLFYLLASVVAAAIGFWNKTITDRVTKLEESNGQTSRLIALMERRLEERFTLHEKYEREIDERHVSTFHQEITSLRRELTDGHKEIIAQVHALAVQVRNGNNQ